MFNVTLYEFTKKENSTKRPTGGTAFSCILRRGSSAMTPSLEFNIGGAAGNPTGYNYAYIPAFSRYYFIRDWSYSEGIWTASCSVDVLATYKSEIGAESLYMLRASAASDGRIVDTMYPTKTGCTFETVTAANPWSLTAGSFAVGAVNQTPTIGSVCYYWMSMAQMVVLNDALLGDGSDSFWDSNGFNQTDASWALQKSIVDPIQYVKSAVYIPMAVDAGGMQARRLRLNSFKVGTAWDDVYPPTFTAAQSRVTTSRTFTLPKHPQAASRGAYMNSTPNTIYTLTFPPFGVIEIDGSVAANAASVVCDVEVDLPTGLGILTVRCNGIVLNRLEAQVGVPVQVSQITRDYVGAVTSILGAIGAAVPAIAGIAAGAATGGAAAGLAIGGASGVASNIGNAAKALAPREQTVGSGGSYSQLMMAPRLDAQFFEAVPDDNAHNGRPYCQMATPASLGGYMLVRDGDVPINGTSDEAAAIRSYLEGGFYYE